MPKTPLLAMLFFAVGAVSSAAIFAASNSSGVALAAQKTVGDAQAIGALELRLASVESELARLKSAISVNNAGNVTINAAKLKVNAPQLEVSSATAKFSGIIKGTAVHVDSVVAKSYTPGAGNVW
jgi:hypothetical protein